MMGTENCSKNAYMTKSKENGLTKVRKIFIIGTFLSNFFFCMNDSIDPQESGQCRNENSSRKQAITKPGKERWRVNHPKHKERAVAKDIKAKQTFVEKGFHTTLPK